MSVLSLIYHDITPAGGQEDSGRRGPGPALYKLTVDQFEAHLAVLDQIRHELRTDWSSAVAPDAESAVLLTFDDGGAAAALHIAPLLEAHGWRGHFFVVSRLVGQPGFLGGAELRALDAAGHVIGTHSASHPDRFAALAPEQQATEWRESISSLSDHLGRAVEVGSVPGGLFDATVARVAGESGLSALFTSEPHVQVKYAPGCVILGRFSVTRRSSAREIRELVTGRAWRRQRHSVVWSLKRAVRTIGGERYLTARRATLGLFQEQHARNEERKP